MVPPLAIGYLMLRLHSTKRLQTQWHNRRLHEGVKGLKSIKSGEEGVKLNSKNAKVVCSQDLNSFQTRLASFHLIESASCNVGSSAKAKRRHIRMILS